jgi:hypothetical protein
MSSTNSTSWWPAGGPSLRPQQHSSNQNARLVAQSSSESHLRASLQSWPRDSLKVTSILQSMTHEAQHHGAAGQLLAQVACTSYTVSQGARKHMMHAASSCCLHLLLGLHAATFDQV